MQDEADRVLPRHYGFTAEPARRSAELDFILNYDIKYRLNGHCWLSRIRNGVIISASSAPGAPAGVNERAMKKATDKTAGPEMRAEYDFSRGVRGKYARRYAKGTNVVVLEADVAKAFPNAEAVNSSLRLVS